MLTVTRVSCLVTASDLGVTSLSWMAGQRDTGDLRLLASVKRVILCFRTLGRRPGGRSRRRGGRGQSGGGGPAGAQDVAASMLPSEGLPLVSGRVSDDDCYVTDIISLCLREVSRMRRSWCGSVRGLVSAS